MSEAAVMEKRSTVKKNVGDSKEFAETFKPKKGDAGLEKAVKEAPKKKKRRFLKVIIILLVFVLLIGGAGAALYFSGNLNYVLSLVGLSLPQAEVGESIEQREAALGRRAADLDAREELLNDLEAQLNEQQAALDEKEEQENEEKTFEEIRAGLSEQKLAELEQVGVIYSKMDPASAASIMTEIYDAQQIAVIVYYMKPAASALTLAEMDAELAADVTEILMS